MKKEIGGAIGVGNVASSIVILRRQRVILDNDLAQLYGVTTKRFNEQVRRNYSKLLAHRV